MPFSNTMKKIWLISKYGATPEQNGPQRQFSLSNNFSNQNLDTTLIISRSNGCNLNPSFKHYYKIVKYENLKVVTLNGPLIGLGFSLSRILSWIIFEINLLRYSFSIQRNQHPHIIIVSSLSFFTILSGVILKKRFNCKLLIEIRDIWPLTLIHIGKFNEKSLIIKILAKIEKIGYNNADGIIGTMPRLDLHINKIVKRPYNYISIPMGFSKAQYSSAIGDGNKIIDRIQLPKEKFVIAYAGTIGQANLVNEIVSVATLLTEYTDIFFAIFGDGLLREQLENDSIHLRNIKFFGQISKYEIIPLLRNCNLLLSPINKSPVYDYGVSFNKWIDYMLSSRPILASYSGYQSIINEAGCGFFIDANNPELMAQKILEIIRMDTDILDRMGENGYNYVIKNHNYEKLSKDYIEFMKNIEND